MARAPLRHFPDERVHVVEEHALEDGTAFALGLQGRQSYPERIARDDHDGAVRALVTTGGDHADDAFAADESDFDTLCVLSRGL
jgi:hypothetical protein